MSAAEISDVVVVGGGIIGITSALALQAAGRQVTLLDRDEPGTGCSAGNAGVIATSFVLPLSSWSHLLGAPRMLLSAKGPLTMPLRHLPHYGDWLLRFALNATQARRRRSTEAIKRLNRESLRAWRALLGAADSAALLRERGMLDVVRAGRSLQGIHAHADTLAAEGVAIEKLTASDVAELEPALRGRVGGGTWHRDVAHVTHPLQVSRSLLARFAALGGRIERLQVEGLSPAGRQIEILGAGRRLRANTVLVSAGWWSRILLAPLGLHMPLRAERGYHLMVSDPAPALSRPVSFHEESFLATPMTDGLRLAGTVELAPPAAPPDWRRAQVLLSLAQTYLPTLQSAAISPWVGSRPSLPDSLPAIGRSAQIPQLLYAFGHQHLGLTQAAVTAELIRDLAAGRAPVGIDSFSLLRFGTTAHRATFPDVQEVTS